MKKIFIMFICILNICTISLADDFIDEELTVEDLEYIKQVSADVTKEPVIDSRAAVVIDKNSKRILFAKNANEKQAMASTTKIMTAIITIEHGNLNEMVEVSEKAGWTGGSRLGLKKGDKVTLRNLLYGLMLCSGNDAAVAIAEHIGGTVDGFIELMNEKAVSLGLKDTNFVTPHGLDDDNHYTTPYELALITEYALNIKEIKNIVNTQNAIISINGYPKNIKNTNELLGVLNGVNGVKTGFTNNAGRCLVTSVSRNGFDIICVVLGADTKKIRTKDSVTLIEYCYQKYELVDINEKLKREFEEWISKSKINVNKGINNGIKLKVNELQSNIIPISKNDIKDIIVDININTNLEAPVLIEQILGKIDVKVNSEILVSTDVICLEGVKKKEMSDYFFYMVSNMKFILENVIT